MSRFFPLPDRFIFVETLSDLPAPVSSVITLVDDYGYFFTDLVDIGSNQIEWGASTTLFGTSQEKAGITSTATTTVAMIKSRDTAPARFIKFSATNRPLLDMDGSVDPNSAIDWVFVNISDTPDMGMIVDYGNVIGLGIGFLASEGLTFDGSFGTIGFDNTIFRGSGSGTIITIPSTATITRRFRATSCAFIAFGTSTALDVSTSATIDPEGYVLQNCAFSGGATYLTGLDHTDDKSRFEGNRGIKNTSVIGHYYMNSNEMVTTITAVDTPVKAAGTTTAGALLSKFTHTANRIEYASELKRDFEITAIASVTSTLGPTVTVYIAKNGAVLADSQISADLSVQSGGNLTTKTFVAMGETDYLEVWVENNSATRDITIVDLIFTARPA